MVKAIIISILALVLQFRGDFPIQDTTIRGTPAPAPQDSATQNRPATPNLLPTGTVTDSLWASMDTTAVVHAPVNVNAFLLETVVDRPLQDSVYNGTLAGRPARPYGTWVYAFIDAHAYFKAAEASLRLPSLVRNPAPREWIFYLFAGLLFYLALLRLAFPKYFQDLLRVFFNSSLRQKQIREQLIQEPLPSLLLNLFFVVSGGLFLYFVLGHQGLAAAYPKWMVLGACILLLAVVYLVKFVAMRAFGWIFGKSEVVETYLFVVFMVNKMAGMVLLPFTVLLAYASANEASTLSFLALVALGILGLYRLVRGFSAIHKTFRINQLQFILCVAAFEVVPILLLYKGLNTLF